jgi:serine/threonine protein kinase
MISSDSDSMRTIFRDIAVNIKMLHDMKKAHNDIKLENVMLHTYDGGKTYHAVLIDYGLASHMVGRFIDSTDGPLAYKPPEIVRARRLNLIKDLLYDTMPLDMSVFKKALEHGVDAKELEEVNYSDNPREEVIQMLLDLDSSDIDDEEEEHGSISLLDRLIKQEKGLQNKFLPNDVWAYGIMLLEVFIDREPRNEPVNQDNIDEILEKVEYTETCPQGVKELIRSILE